MDTQSSRVPITADLDPAATLAEELPVLYRAILDRVAAIQQLGDRREAARIRIAATKIYSDAWHERARARLFALQLRADRAIAGRERSRSWPLTGRRRSLPSR